jgi:hypothetical protein
VELWDEQWTGSFKGVQGTGRDVVRGIARHVAGGSLERLHVLSHKDYVCVEARRGVCGVQCELFGAGTDWMGSNQKLYSREGLAGSNPEALRQVQTGWVQSRSFTVGKVWLGPIQKL